jgi:BirA family biotin operon repressor/biotin-[acetyl-CoA-carboxylase] ligase
MTDASKFINIKRFSHLDSTFSAAQVWLDDNIPDEFSVVLADYQTNGKGAGSNSWESSDGKNILLSMILYPKFLFAKDQFQLHKVFSLAIFDTVKHFIPGGNVAVKWPNDILVEKKKIAGLLFRNTVESEMITTSIAGIGLNVNQESFPDYIPNPCSLKTTAGKAFDKEQVLIHLIDKIQYYYCLLKDGKFDYLDQVYLKRLFNYQKDAEYLIGDKKLHGQIVEVSNFGQLGLLAEGRLLFFDMKEIQFIL